MTKDEFNEAIDCLKDGDWWGSEGGALTRVIAAAGLVMRNRLKPSLPDDEACEPTPEAMAEFINSLDKRQLRLLKEAAEGLEDTGSGPLH
jgi:hypothetical protein